MRVGLCLLAVAALPAWGQGSPEHEEVFGGSASPARTSSPKAGRARGEGEALAPLDPPSREAPRSAKGRAKRRVAKPKGIKPATGGAVEAEAGAPSTESSEWMLDLSAGDAPERPAKASDEASSRGAAKTGPLSPSGMARATPPPPGTEQVVDGGVAEAAEAAPVVERGGPTDHEALRASLFGAEEGSATAAPTVPSTTEPERRQPEEDPLKIGGQASWRARVVANQRTAPSKWELELPAVLDAFFDARPSDRVRGFVLGRLTYNPVVGPTSTSALLAPAAAEQFNVLLDQLWFRFDVARLVFVTAGRQHVKWGVGRIWNPTDYLHQAARDPLAQVDTRAGTTMLKLHVPWESQGWNFYGIGLFEDTTAGGALGKVGAGMRIEAVFGTAELGLDALFQMDHWPKLGADLSAGLGPIDLYAEVALRYTSGTDRSWYTSKPDLSRVTDASRPTAALSASCARSTIEGTTLQVVGGVSHPFSVADEHVLTVGGEYFYNSLGTGQRKDYACLMMNGQFSAFYAGRHYGAIYAGWSTPSRRTAPEFKLTNLSNLSDGSHLLRLDFAMVLLAHLRVEAHAAYHYGTEGGEFRFGLDMPETRMVDPLGYAHTVAAFRSEPPVAEVGVGIRINL